MRTRLSVVVSVMVAVAALLAQTPSTIRELEQASRDPDASSVRLEIYPTDDGRPIADLQQRDVDVFEDNVAQTVTSFTHVDGAAGPRLFIVFLDTYHLPLDVAAALRVPFVKFIDRLAGPDDIVAVMTPDMSAADVQLRRKAAVMSDIMQDVTVWARSGRSVSGNDAKDDLYADCYAGQRRAVADEMTERRHEMLAIDGLDNLVAHLRHTRPERKAVIAVTDGWRVFTANPALGRNDTRSRMQGIFGGLGGGRGGFGGRGGGGGGAPRAGEARDVSSDQMAECETDRASLAMLDDSVRIRRLVDDANRATVSVYPVLASGVAPVQRDTNNDRRGAGRVGEPRQASLSDRAATLRELADNTDGIAITDGNGIDPALTRIAADTGSYYLLSYTSTNTKLDGRFRTVAVRVNRPGVRVRARRGYRGLTADELGAAPGESASTGAKAVGALRSASGRQPFRVRTAAWYAPASPGATLWIVGELDYGIRKELAWSAGATGDVVVLAPDGSEVASQAIDVRPTDGRFAVHLPDGAAAVAPGEYAVRVRLHPDAEPATTVSETARVQVAKEPSTVGEAVMWRRGPSTGPQFMMTADTRFERTERIRIELPTTSSAAPSARLVDRTGNPLPLPVQVSTREDAAAGFRWVVADLALAPLGVGDYAIEVTVGGVRQTAAFALVP